ncbi:MAG: hypothetical protein RQ760_11115, partial [Sedimentisphaerales bacterium]|nr:hypothetical protein [Sedimentisphaerales bacterium]
RSLESCVLSLWSICSTFVENIRQIHPFYAKQTQFSGLLNNVNSSQTRIYEENRPKYVTKKQTQFKANKAKNKPNLSQYKPNSNPIIKVYPEFIPEKCKLGFTTGQELLTWLITGDLFIPLKGASLPCGRFEYILGR